MTRVLSPWTGFAICRLRSLPIILLLAPVSLAVASQGVAQQWPQHGGDNGGSRYSAAGQVTPENVDELEIAWIYRTGEEARRGTEKFNRSSFQVTPLLLPPEAGGSLVLCTPFNRVVALDPTNGQERWAQEPDIAAMNAPYRCRGVAYWGASNIAVLEKGSCDHRVFSLTADRRLIAIDARTGKLCEEFADNGTAVASLPEKALFPGEIRSAAPPLVVNDTVVVGSTIQDFARLDSPKGTVLAYDAITGEHKWSFDPMQSTGGGTPTIGQANVWTAMSGDDDRNLVFIATSAPSGDWWGGHRPGANEYSNSTIALDADTGEIVWNFQVVHHDIWDYDLPAQPVLADIGNEDASTPVVIQATKQGLIFVFDRDSGEPYFAVEERSVPQQGLPGEMLSPTQPFPVLPPPIHPYKLEPEDAWGVTFYDRGECRKKIESLRSDGLYTPVSLQGSVSYPSTLGGVNWGSVAFDPATNTLVTNTSRVAMEIRAFPVGQESSDGGDGEMGGDKAFKPLFPEGSPFGFQMTFINSPFGAPCSKPPWGTLVGIDLTDGSIKWEVTLGTIKKMIPVPIPIKWGTPNLGGPIITAGGLIFIGAAMDDMIRAFELETGKEIWSDDLPAGGQATPMSYEIDGRQYIVIAAGGHDILNTTRGDYVLAYALPDD